MNLEGKILGNRYQIIEKIGNGGMATVYKAKCLVLNRYVAVKVLRDEFTTDNEFVRRFNIEAQSVASLTHPNIVSVYDVGQDGNLYYIVMELIKGKTLKEIIIEEGKLGWKWSVQIAMQIASALETAHRNHIIHRDIKPHNIIITEDGVAKVTDFGIAKAVSNSTITAFGTTIGSVHYFSPEHAKGGHTDEKSDIYSLGVVMYEMVTGKVPFDADTPVSVALKHMQEEPISPMELNTTIPRMLNNIVLKAMQKEPSARYQNSTEMIRDLNLVLKNPEAVGPIFPNTTMAATQKISLDEINKSINKEEPTAREKSKQVSGKKKAPIIEFFKKHPAIRVATICLSFILVFILSIVITLWALSLGEVKDIQIPDFVGMTVEEANKKLTDESINLKLEVAEEKYDPNVEVGKIISQDPKYQNKFTVKENSTVKVIVSLGQEMITVPKFVGKTRDEARQEAVNIGIDLEIQEEYNKEVEKDYVIEQDIQENEEILAGSKVIIKISLGIEQVEVPDVIGKTESEAVSTLTDAGLTVKAVLKTSDSSKENGKIIDQTIAAKSKVDKETEITITLNEFNEIKRGTLSINVAKLTNYEPTYKNVDVVDPETGETTVKQEIIAPKTISLRVTMNDEQIELRDVNEDKEEVVVPIEGTGTVEIKVFIDESRKAMKMFNFNTDTTLRIE